MFWRKRFLQMFSPGILSGITFGDWVRLLRENGITVDLPYWPRAAVITAGSIGNSLLRMCEERMYGAEYRQVEIEPPLFILGFGRSGTTYLHQLLAIDQRFAYPNFYQVRYPHTFLSAEVVFSRLAPLFLPQKRVQDNVRVSWQTPGEDEIALCALSLCSTLMEGVFMGRRAHYGRYRTFQQASQHEIAVWKEALKMFLKKLTWKYRRPMILKSPQHTCRIKLLLEMFPTAKFVHIQRNPYDVFLSTRRTFQDILPYRILQHDVIEDLDELLIRRYQETYQAFFEQKHIIPDHNLHEVRFEELERDPLGQMRRLYEALALPDVAEVEPALLSYIQSLSGYQKSVYPELSIDLRQRIARACRPCFEEWGYPV
jgi:omega-hydroxy-beta-dihydromenaquinone-9 sulfotransferase